MKLSDAPGLTSAARAAMRLTKHPDELVTPHLLALRKAALTLWLRTPWYRPIARWRARVVARWVDRILAERERLAQLGLS